MPLLKSIIRNPTAGVGIEMQKLTFLFSITATLPREHRPLMSLGLSIKSGLRVSDDSGT